MSSWKDTRAYNARRFRIYVEIVLENGTPNEVAWLQRSTAIYDGNYYDTRQKFLNTPQSVPYVYMWWLTFDFIFIFGIKEYVHANFWKFNFYDILKNVILSSF